jgi:hypothetical protein
VYKENLAVDVSSPIVYTLKLESHLNRLSIQIIQMITKILAVSGQLLEEKIPCVITV